MPDDLPDDLKAALAERNRAFEAGDLEWVRKQIPNASSPRVIEMAFHKARYECRQVSAKMRRESQCWLIENHVARIDGTPVIPGDPLPR